MGVCVFIRTCFHLDLIGNIFLDFCKVVFYGHHNLRHPQMWFRGGSFAVDLKIWFWSGVTVKAFVCVSHRSLKEK